MCERKPGRVLVVGHVDHGRGLLLAAAQSVADRTGGSVVVVDASDAAEDFGDAMAKALESAVPHPIECLNPPVVVHPCPPHLKAPPWRQPRKGGRRRA